MQNVYALQDSGECWKPPARINESDYESIVTGKVLAYLPDHKRKLVCYIPRTHQKKRADLW